MSLFGRLYRGETTIDFVGARRTFLIISSVLLVVSALSLAIRGLNLSLDFRGGVSPSRPRTRPTPEWPRFEMRWPRWGFPMPGFSCWPTDRSSGPDGGSRSRSGRPVRAGGGRRGRHGGQETSVDEVGPTFGAQIAERAVLALVVFLGAVILFMSWRLEWKMALSGIAALFHDLVITFGVYSITGFEVTPATVIAVLTILGYSLYDTVVVFDKVKENIETSDRVTHSPTSSTGP